MEEIKNFLVEIERNALRKFWESAVIDAERGRETGGVLCGRINPREFKARVQQTKGIVHGMSRKEIEKRFSSLKELLKEIFNVNVEIKGAVEIKRFLRETYWPKGEIIGDIHTHPSIRNGLFLPFTPYFSSLDILNNQTLCKELAQALDKKEYYYFSLLLPSPFPEAKILWDFLFEEIGRKMNLSEREAKAEFGYVLADRKKKLINLREIACLIEKELELPGLSHFALKMEEKMLAPLFYMLEFGKFAGPFCKPYSIENYRKTLKKGKEIYETMTKRKDFPKNKLLEWMRKRDFLYELAEYNLFEGEKSKEFINVIISVCFSKLDKDEVELHTGRCKLIGRKKEKPKIENFLENYKKHFKRPFYGIYGIPIEISSIYKTSMEDAGFYAKFQLDLLMNRLDTEG